MIRDHVHMSFWERSGGDVLFLVVLELLCGRLGSFWGRSGVVLGLFWGCSGVVLESFWDWSGLVLGPCGVVLGSFWECFGVVLGGFWNRFVGSS